MSVSIVFEGGAFHRSSAAESERASGSRYEARSIGRDVAAVNFEVLEFA
jgi:hypothetical protein